MFAFSFFISNLLCSWIALHLPFPLHSYIWQFLLIRKFVCVLDLCLNVCICIWIVLSICFGFAVFLNCALSALPPLRLPGILIDSKLALLRLQNSEVTLRDKKGEINGCQTSHWSQLWSNVTLITTLVNVRLIISSTRLNFFDNLEQDTWKSSEGGGG